MVEDKAFDAEWLLRALKTHGAEAAIPARKNWTYLREHDRVMYKWRHRIENFFAKIREFRAVATRYDKSKRLAKA